MNGRSSYSSIKTIDHHAPLTVLAYPNPFVNKIKIDANIPAGSIVIRLTDATGKTVITRKQHAGNMSEIIIDGLERLAGGAYYLSIEDVQGRKVSGAQVIRK